LIILAKLKYNTLFQHNNNKEENMSTPKTPLRKPVAYILDENNEMTDYDPSQSPYTFSLRQVRVPKSRKTPEKPIPRHYTAKKPYSAPAHLSAPKIKAKHKPTILTPVTVHTVPSPITREILRPTPIAHGSITHTFARPATAPAKLSSKQTAEILSKLTERKTSIHGIQDKRPILADKANITSPLTPTKLAHPTLSKEEWCKKTWSEIEKITATMSQTEPKENEASKLALPETKPFALR
jgi:hypothetical protein